jgi:F-type H+-transporting ATPase subunit a
MLFFIVATPAAYASDGAVEETAGGGVSIHLAPEVIGHAFGIPITNTLITTWLVMAGIIIFAILVRRSLRIVPGGLQAVVETAVGGGYEYVKNILNENDTYARRYFPIVATIFLFVLFLNWIGLVPGMDAFGTYRGGVFVPFLHGADTDLNITFAFALIAFVTVEVAGILTLGALKYGNKFVNVSSPLAFALGIMELISELARLIAFSFRLFGNVFAGETLLLVIAFFVPVALPVPFMAFELFVGFIQAFIFAVLTLFFIKLAITPAEGH